MSSFTANLSGASLLKYLALATIPLFTWRRLYKSWRKLKLGYEAERLFHNCHNCVVMYSRERGAVGWPGRKESRKQQHLEVFDSILYFIHTATRSLDIAMMIISSSTLADAVIRAHKRGVKVRVVLDHSYTSSSSAQDLAAAGVEVLHYICPDPKVESIMHYKYIVKDYSDGHGFTYVGSLNWTSHAMQENYENTVFSSSPRAAKAFHDNFEWTWNYISDTNKHNNVIRAKLHSTAC